MVDLTLDASDDGLGRANLVDSHEGGHEIPRDALGTEDKRVPLQRNGDPRPAGAARSSKKLIRWILSICFVPVVLIGIKWLAETVEVAPLCELQIFSDYVPHCAPVPPKVFSPDFRKLVMLQSRLQGAMEKSTNTLIVAVDIKRSEVAVRDLTTLVKLSSLVSKDSLVKKLNLFVDDAKNTGRGLQKFGGHVGSAVDQIVAMNEYTIETLESAAKDTQPENSLFPRSRSSQAIAIETRNKEMKAVWLEATGLMKTSIEQLSLEAVANMRSLDRLDEQLSVIHTMVAREDHKINGEKAETLSELWTKLGGNQVKLDHFKSHSELLKNILDYRKEAANHVSGTLLQLERLEMELQELNDQATTSLLTNGESFGSLDVHIRVMQKETDRLLEGRAREREREDNYMREIIGNSRSEL